MGRHGPFYGAKNLANYGDWDSTRVFIIDVDKMSLLKIVEDTGDGPYGVDQQDPSSAYVLTRLTESLTIIDNHHIENVGEILLIHRPRSTNYNPDTGLSLVSGADKVMTSIIRVENDEAVLSEYPHGNLDPAQMGSHHADFHPDGVHIYVGSAEGHVFVVNKNTMEIVTMIKTGKGSGHTTFVPLHNVAFVTNHNDTHMTVIDTINHRKLMNIKVATTSSPDYKSQAHTSGVSADQRYFYSAASHDGVFFRIDVEKLVHGKKLEISRLNLELEIDDDVNILMGSFIWDGEGDNM
jgi:WD40 repeat protein